ncbi:MAG: hypothetical protein U1A73_04530, partial [Pseudomonas sp.]|nr:hypothetical protein [Pseudomonas sp.]
STQTVGQLAHQVALTRPMLPLRRCGFCAKDLGWHEPTSARFGDEMHRACASAFDAAAQRIKSQAQRLGYATGCCAWCRVERATLRFVNTAVPGWVCKECRGIPDDVMEG